ncbi:tryptophan synthase subunit alpha [Tenacibaculum finnmarkense]|uniref:tryptophan synthase subunit alpha n=1 Tax=Tenacibaculum finnmarkense TaxID=2781243 RepID=UPI000C383F83|nr:tryptophan synthase subunit alpha [Tenacibaculum finnmarkense]MCD8440197.1 tryptophan synthase subunit alpha [Tenacibaculum finnmarkense genomovar ulcerans]MCD8445967.1 tryptophan synthase subunit alpha [Tenacibaculum finnmarkense genomovar finnmarkense]MCG8721012.1 tryptophan synthase subunit alpha [Tenacibaculum finnmarkense]MCG8881769.1 tryptophan synthase subunit alpha [Tenacibaculum finnmarkense]SOS54581.1 Tryptophan synthase alpha chain [Tenacibaculum finnmarkense]
MKLLKEIFQEKKNLLSIFFTAGFPKLDDTTKIIHDLSENGVDFIEVGLPYSDPLADGTTIQDSSHRALQNGMNLDVVFEQLKSVKDTNKTPLVLMGYLNQLIKYGEDKFCQAVQDCGMKTVIFPDLPMIEYENHYKALFEKYGITNVFLITPHTSEERIRKIDALTDAFIYVVASASITGAKGEISTEQIDYFKRIEAMNLKSKLVVGFGISDNKTFTTACNYADGAIIGSAFIKDLDKNGVAGISNFVSTVINA